jgi:hypothetical protein
MEEEMNHADCSDQTSSFEPFPDVNTIPNGWNVESILNPSPPRKPEAEPMPSIYEKFQEPRTCPPGWRQS